MIKGLYTAGSAMMLCMARQDVIANNLANVNTSGYKRDTTICQAFPEMVISRLGEKELNNRHDLVNIPPVVIGKLTTGAVVKEIVTDHTMGNINNTGQPTDLALSREDAYFVINTPDGERFTRDGAFKLNNEGILVNNAGYPVMDSGDQPINIDGEFTVDNDGNIIVDNEIVTRLKIVSFADPKSLKKEGGWMGAGGQEYTEATNPGVKQGYLELSNVNAVKEMVTLISAVRAYETSQKVVQAEDDIMGAAINQVGALGK